MVQTALARLSLGLSVVPIPKPFTGEDKAYNYSWKRWQSERMSPAEAEEEFTGAWGIAVVCGKVSAGLWVLDFDREDLLEGWKEIVRHHVSGPWMEKLLIERTRGGGHHVLFRLLTDVPGNEKLAMGPARETLIETRGEGGLIFCEPTEGYELLQGSWGAIPTLDGTGLDVCRRAARMLSEYVELPEEPQYRKGETGRRPGDIYNEQAPSWQELLSADGWTRVGLFRGLEYFRRPGKKKGVSATAGPRPNGKDLLKVFTSNAPPLEPERAYSKFSYLVKVRHGGDASAAAKAVCREYEVPKTLPVKEERIKGVTEIEAERTDVGNALRLARLLDGDFRYCHPWKRWLVWDGCRWKVDETGDAPLLQKAVQLTRIMIAESADKWAYQQQNQARLKAMCELVKATEGIQVAPDELDADDWLLNCPNGVLDLRTFTLRPHCREDLMVKMAGAVYDEDAEAPVFRKFLDETTLGRRDLLLYLVKVLGSALTGSTAHQQFYILYGHGQNGKGVLMRAMAHLMGDYYGLLPEDSLMEKKFDGIPADIAALHGARFVWTGELPERRKFSEVMLKKLTGGDPITARRLHENFFTFQPKFKLFMSANQKPEIGNFDYALARRMRLIPFDYQVPDDKRDNQLDDKIRGELSGILNYVLEGLLMIGESGLMAPSEVTVAVKEYQADMDNVADFINECCLVGDAYRVTSSKLFKAYRKWCEDTGAKSLGPVYFPQRMVKKGFGKVLHGNVKVFKGIGLKDEPPLYAVEGSGL